MDDFDVRITYYNKDMEPMVEKRYSLKDYTEMIRFELMRVLTDIEELVVSLQGEKKKEDWDPEVLNGFNRIRHKLLDESNAVKRLPNTLYYRNIPCTAMTSGEMIANIVNNLSEV